MRKIPSKARESQRDPSRIEGSAVETPYSRLNFTSIKKLKGYEDLDYIRGLESLEKNSQRKRIGKVSKVMICKVLQRRRILVTRNT